MWIRRKEVEGLREHNRELKALLGWAYRKCGRKMPIDMQSKIEKAMAKGDAVLSNKHRPF